MPRRLWVVRATWRRARRRSRDSAMACRCGGMVSGISWRRRRNVQDAVDLSAGHLIAGHGRRDRRRWRQILIGPRRVRARDISLTALIHDGQFKEGTDASRGGVARREAIGRTVGLGRIARAIGRSCAMAMKENDGREANSNAENECEGWRAPFGGTGTALEGKPDARDARHAGASRVIVNRQWVQLRSSWRIGASAR
jgi:hypothetical protein